MSVFLLLCHVWIAVGLTTHLHGFTWTSSIHRPRPFNVRYRIIYFIVPYGTYSNTLSLEVTLYYYIFFLFRAVGCSSRRIFARDLWCVVVVCCRDNRSACIDCRWMWWIIVTLAKPINNISSCEYSSIFISFTQRS